MKRFLALYFGILVRPRGVYGELADDPAPLIRGLQAVLFIGGLYTITVIGAAAHSFPISVEPWIPLPPERYYFWEIFFALPVMFFVTVIIAGGYYSLAGGMNGRGRFDMVFAVTALALNAPMFIFMWVPETIVLLSGSLTLADVLFPPVVNEIRQLIPPVWTLLLLILLLKRETGLGWPAHLAALLPSFFAGAIVAFTYIR
jgi:hypothetical protein